MRAEGSNFHHSIFLFHRQGTKQYFNHVAFEVNSFDEIMTGGQYMLERGAESVSGPGRHSLGSNCFWYFRILAAVILSTLRIWIAWMTAGNHVIGKNLHRMLDGW